MYLPVPSAMATPTVSKYEGKSVQTEALHTDKMLTQASFDQVTAVL